MKGTAKIPALIITGLLACCLLFAGNTGHAAFLAKSPFKKEISSLSNDNVPHRLFNLLSKHARYSFTVEKNRKRCVLGETDLQIGVVGRQPEKAVAQKAAFIDSFYSLAYFYHFTSRGPPAYIFSQRR